MKLRSAWVLGAIGLALLVGCNDDPDPLSVGSLAPNFKVASASDASKTVSLVDLKGKAVLIDFWATWCGPCRVELPHLDEIWKKNEAKGLCVLAISKENPRDILGYRTESNLGLPMYSDPSGDSNKAFNVTGYPTVVVVGKDGKIIYSVAGVGPEVAEQLEAAVVKALG